MHTDQMTLDKEETVFAVFGKIIGNERKLAFHKVDNGSIQAEIPMTKEHAAAIAAEFNEYEKKQLQFKGVIPKNVVFTKSDGKNDTMIFTVKSHKRVLYFDGDHGIDKKVDCMLPNLVFIYNNGSLTVLASLTENINESTKLYLAPFMNVDDSGNVCMGNVKINKVQTFDHFETAIHFLKKVFFSSVFTHSNYSGILNAEYNKKCYSLSKYTTKDLHETSITISNFI